MTDESTDGQGHPYASTREGPHSRREPTAAIGVAKPVVRPRTPSPPQMKVFTVVGNRPQFIKAAPLSPALRAAGIEEVVLHTGQHWYHTLSQVFFDQLGVPEPRYRLDLHTADTAAMEPLIAQHIRAES